MSISSTRKVSSSTGGVRSTSLKRAEHNYSSGSDGESFVEVIDASNNVSVRDDERDTKDKRKQAFEKPERDSEKSKISNAPTYIPSAIEALSASGVYDEVEENTNISRVNVYGNNQTIIKDEEVERTGHSYLKHFYEKNELLEEVDELV